jgi:hypothetical protein
LSFAQKQEQKKQDKIGIQAIQNMFGLDETTAKAMYKDDVVRDAFVMKQKADADLVRKQREQVELEILQAEFEASKADEEALQKAISVNITPEGTLDKSGLESSYLELGGTNLKVLDLFKEPGEVKVDQETGIITQDGVFKGQIASSLLDIEPTESELKLKQLEIDKKQAEVDKLLAQIEKIKAGDTSYTTSIDTPGVSILSIDGQPLN